MNMFQNLKQFPQLEENENYSDKIQLNEEINYCYFKDIINESGNKQGKLTSAKCDQQKEKVFTLDEYYKTQGKNMKVLSDQESIDSDSYYKSTASSLGEWDNEIAPSQDSILSTVKFDGEDLRLNKRVQELSSDLVEKNKPKGKKQKSQVFTLDEFLAGQVSDKKKSNASTAANECHTVNAPLPGFIKVKDIDSQDEYTYEYASSFNELIEEKFQEIFEHRFYFGRETSFQLDQLKKELKNLYQSHIEEQVLTQKKSCIILELHRINKDDVTEILKYCRTAILNLKKHIKPCTKQNKKCIHVSIITGQGNNQTIYNLVKSLLKKNDKQYYVQDHRNQGLVDTYLYI